MSLYVLEFEEIDQTKVAIVGGKGAHLGELSRIDRVPVPPGFCVTTHAFERMLAVDEQLSSLVHDGSIGAEVRCVLETAVIPEDVVESIADSLRKLGEQHAYAVRSSATAEDMPVASFAGQYETYLNVVGLPSILDHIKRCWASLFTERAITYRLRSQLDQRDVKMAVVVQQMVFAESAGILFTADPVTGNRKVSSVEASFGLGEALVSGLVNADVYKVRDDKVVSRSIGTKQLAIHALPAGGTSKQTIEPERQNREVLADEQVLRLARLGRRIEAHFGRSQDIEWCLVDDEFQIVQSRPITTLFPIPAVADDANHVYVSVGHQQMMTDAMKPLGLSFWQMTTPRPMAEAGGRLFVDVTPMLAAPASRASLFQMLGRSDPLIGDALESVLERDGFIELRPDAQGGPIPGSAAEPIETDPSIVTELIKHSEASLATLKRDIHGKSGVALLDFILTDIQELKRILFDPKSHRVFMSAIEATWWLNDHLEEWLGEKNVADKLAQSVPNNVTSEMGLALLDVADVIRPHPEVVTFLDNVRDENFLDELPELAGGPEAQAAILAYLEKYGMRCVGEIDITRPRWSERPITLVPILLSNIKNFESDAGKRRFDQGRQDALRHEQELLARLRALPDGETKASETKEKIDRVRTFIGYREYPKYGMVSRYFIYKQALLEEAQRLADVFHKQDDIFYLRFDELAEVVRGKELDQELVRRRKEEFEVFQKLVPPRVLTSDGEVVTAAYRRDDLPEGALAGLAVSAGIVEGRARVILDLADAQLEPGDILVTAYTDPSWTPLFVAIKGLVTEVGGLMTHGAVIAREYGLPAVVGVERATQLIRDGQRIRVDGTRGYVEILEDPSP